MTERRGWALAVAAAGANFASFGILFSFGLFLTPLATDFDTSTGPVAPLFSASVLLYYLANAVGGRLADRHGPRPVVLFGAVAFPAGLVLASRATSLWQLYLTYAPLTGLAVGSCYASLIGSVGRALTEKRALAIAVVLTGVGGGTLVMPLVIRAALDRTDWRGTFQLLAVVTLVLFLATAAVATEANPAAARRTGNPRRMVTSPAFRRLYLSVVLVAPGFYAPLAFLNDYAISRDISTGRAALLVATIGLGSTVSRIAFGRTAQRFGPLRQYRLSHVAFLVGLLLWLAADGSLAVLVISAALHGFGWAAWVTATPLVMADWFGADDLGLLVGSFYTGLGVGALIGPVVSGFVIDRAGYEPALVVVIVTTVASLAVLFAPLRSAPEAAGGRLGRIGSNPIS